MELAHQLREHGIECEFADPEYLVLMLTPENSAAELERLRTALGTNTCSASAPISLPIAKGERKLSVRQAMFSAHETISVEQSLGRICGAPSVSCPPAIPVAVSGEEIGPEALKVFRHYGITMVSVVHW